MSRFESRASAYIGILLPTCRNTIRQARCFHPTSIPKARPIARASPKTRARLQQQEGSIRVRQAPNIEDSLPPVVLLNSARKSGLLQIEPEKALDFLRQYQQLAVNPVGSWEQTLCNQHNIDPATVATLAGILRRSHDKAQQVLAKKIMLTASALGDKSATLEIISAALRLGKLHDYPAPLRQLGILAKKENDLPALTFLGKVHNAHGDKRGALECFRKATRPPTGNLEFYGAGDALVSEGLILLELKDKDGAETAFEKAALELDDPAAYFYLSKLQEPGSPQEQIYLLKAASSGITEAWHNLGALEMAKRKDTITKPSKVEDFGMAYDWFQVAATEGFGLSMLNLALMYKSVGNVEEGMTWLEKAEENADVRDQARAIKADFRNSNVGAI
ncbi:HCP-like protein [Mollisia scopiformis]|uniref:HCP-like protein n=1 Tax=Mollisia scopiformis TaxID=149040 RepID=A0A194XH28_MOLSC|nr:HCP-like protein [Mollisia scopiformis]KUJ19077.1 HCP-like protein [Mollisia scopiformis]